MNVGRKAINAYYGLEKIKGNGYMTYLNKDLDYSKVIPALSEPGTKWKLIKRHEVVNFPSTKISRYGKAWHTFICVKLMLYRHMSDVTS